MSREPSKQQGSGLDIYLIAIGGTGMAPLACLLRDLGHRVRGVDGPLYPPMSDVLASVGIEPLVGYDAAHLEAEPRPDLVIVGNAVPRSNPEVETAERLGLDRLSMPQALARFLLEGRRSLVVAGTHGKTTTSSMAAVVWSRCGRDPGFLIGGVARDLGVSYRVGTGDRFVVEGDEYNAAYFDRGPKFLHYQPKTLILTSVEHDHVDLYPEHETLLAAFRRLVELVPEDGLVVVCGDTDDAREVAASARCRVIFYGLGERNDVRAKFEGDQAVIEDRDGRHELRMAVPGDHNLLNATAVWVAARADGLEADDVAEALGHFQGAKRRLEELATRGGVTVVDDFAHHPTAVAASLSGLRRRHPGRRLIALFEPRSLTAGRSFFFEPYLAAFAVADLVLLAPIHYRQRLSEDDALDLEALVKRLGEAGVEATICTSTDDVLARALELARAGDVLVTMSSGSFDGLPRRLADSLPVDSLPVDSLPVDSLPAD